MNFRQVHLDFHTSEKIGDIGKRFDKEEWKEALQAGHVNSITLFSKCHHGYAYHPTTANEMHPGLDFDLLGEQLAVCKELSINAPVYISAGYDEKEALKHPDWLMVSSLGAGHDFMHPGYHLFCYNTPYLDRLVAQVEEVMERYQPSGVFLDISNVRVCYCPHCIASMIKVGHNPRVREDVITHGEEVYTEYCNRIEAAVRKYNKNTAIFHNSGHVACGRRDLARKNTHLELESLPTGGWGYDHFPMSAAYVRTLGMDYLGMTGKFHRTWGEFGGFKHPNALRYEAALSLAFGAKCSIGDQLHPSGAINLSTYRLIGAAYAEIEEKEAWCDHVEAVADIAILSSEACRNYLEAKAKLHNLVLPSDETLENYRLADRGCSRILLEGKYLFDMIDLESTLEEYKLVILADYVLLDEELGARISKYLATGGKVLATGKSGLNLEQDKFLVEMGISYLGESQFRPTYMVPNTSDLKKDVSNESIDHINLENERQNQWINGETNYIMYEKAYAIRVEEQSKVLAYLAEPYFNRTLEHFCSHFHTPEQPDSKIPAAILNENIGYIGWCVFEEYATIGSLHLKELVVNAIEALLGEQKTLKVSNLPDRGIVTVMKQGDRYINHLLFTHTTIRGNNTEIIEDIVPIYNVEVTIAMEEKPSRVYLAPQNEDITYEYAQGKLTYQVDKLHMHQMVAVE